MNHNLTQTVLYFMYPCPVFTLRTNQNQYIERFMFIILKNIRFDTSGDALRKFVRIFFVLPQTNIDCWLSKYNFTKIFSWHLDKWYGIEAKNNRHNEYCHLHVPIANLIPLFCPSEWICIHIFQTKISHLNLINYCYICIYMEAHLNAGMK